MSMPMPIYTATNGAPFAFTAYPLWDPPKFGGGVYAFCNWAGTYWHVFYVGRTDSFNDRFDQHHKRFLAAIYGATHLLAHFDDQLWLQHDLEADMIRRLDPVLNERQPASFGTLTQIA